ncbi:hypothetical protein [Mangrovibacterium lignilyticum]|uniref:hypothetical protein n=1 Tax=Mangrovibacterium lignilyticum TaxID=2668052 RepID=UPI0013D57E04|nr:hypothetical protein [Mangrovibacterium lignilyticum]
MSFAAILKLFHVYLLATVKYFLTFPYSMLIGLNFLQTLITVTIGGITGFYFFYYLSGYLIRFYQNHHGTVLCALKNYTRIDLCHLINKNPAVVTVKVNRKMRLIVKLRAKYGFWGIIIMTPSLLSMPIGAFLLNKYYSRQKNTVAYMTLSILGWALLYSSIFIIFPKPL